MNETGVDTSVLQIIIGLLFLALAGWVGLIWWSVRAYRVWWQRVKEQRQSFTVIVPPPTQEPPDGR